MIKSVTVVNYLGDVVKIRLDEAEPEHGLLLISMDGIGPVKANINMTDLVNGDGSVYNSASLGNRNITLKLRFANDIETTRHNTYKYFPIKKQVYLVIETDTHTLTTVGYVENNDPDIWSKSEGNDISIICPDPYFYSLEEKTALISTTKPRFTFPFCSGYKNSTDITDVITELDTWPEKNIVSTLDIGGYKVDGNDDYDSDFIPAKVIVDGVEYLAEDYDGRYINITSVPERANITIYPPPNVTSCYWKVIDWVYVDEETISDQQVTNDIGTERYEKVSFNVPELYIGTMFDGYIQLKYNIDTNTMYIETTVAFGRWTGRLHYTDFQPGSGEYIETREFNNDGYLAITKTGNVNITKVTINGHEYPLGYNIPVSGYDIIEIYHDRSGWGLTNSESTLIDSGTIHDSLYFIVPEDPNGTAQLNISRTFNTNLNRNIDYINLADSTNWAINIDPKIGEIPISDKFKKYEITLIKRIGLENDQIIDANGNEITPDECVFSEITESMREVVINGNEGEPILDNESDPILDKVGDRILSNNIARRYNLVYMDNGELAIKYPYNKYLSAKIITKYSMDSNGLLVERQHVSYTALNINKDDLIIFGDIIDPPYMEITHEGSCLTDTIIEIHCIENIASDTITIYNRATDERVIIDTSKLENGLLKGDILSICGAKDQKKVQLYRDGETYNVLKALHKPITWMHLAGGTNMIYFSTTNNNNIKLTVRYTAAYEGI